MKLISKHPEECSLSSPFACCSPEKTSKRLQACLCVQQKLSVSLVPYVVLKIFFCLLLSTFFFFFFFNFSFLHLERKIIYCIDMH